MKPAPTDIARCHTNGESCCRPLTGLSTGHVYTICVLTRQRLPPRPGRPRSPLPMRVLLVLIHLRTNLTTAALAALFGTSQSAVDRVIDHLAPVLAHSLTPDPDQHHGPRIIDGTLIPAHDQSISAISKNYRAASTPRSSCARTGAR